VVVVVVVVATDVVVVVTFAASGEGIVVHSICVCVCSLSRDCTHFTLVSVMKVMHCTQHSLIVAVVAAITTITITINIQPW